MSATSTLRQGALPILQLSDFYAGTQASGPKHSELQHSSGRVLSNSDPCTKGLKSELPDIASPAVRKRITDTPEPPLSTTDSNYSDVIGNSAHSY